MKVLVVEDEFYARKAMIRQIKKYDQDGLFEISEASNGEEGWEFCEKYKPELVLTDIRMPKMDGVQLLQEIRNNELEIKVIILSAYSDFEYARSAIVNGASDYLLKPIDDTALTECLNKFVTQHKIERKEALLSRKDMATQYILNSIQESKYSGFIEKNMFERVFPQYQLGVFLFLHDKPRQEIFLTELEESCGSIMLTKIRFVELKPDMWILLVRPEGDMLFFWRRIRKLLEKEDSQVKIGISNVYGANASVLDAFREAVTAIKSRIYKRESLIFAKEIKQEDFSEYYLEKEIERELEQYLKEGNESKTGTTLDKLFKDIEKVLPIRIECMELLYSQIILIYRRTIRMENHDKELDNLSEGFLKFDSVLEIESYLRRIAENICHMQPQRQSDELTNTGMDIVEKMSEYAVNNYNMDITIRNLAENVFFMNQSYISHLFAEKKGISFSAFLRMIRICHAKEFLADARWSVTDVALMSGYNDTSQFIRIFRQETGMTPKKYRIFLKNGGFDGGTAPNSVPSFAHAVAENKIGQKSEETAVGISGHAAFPDGTQNAIGILCGKLKMQNFPEQTKRALEFVERLSEGGYGEKTEICCSDECSGRLTCNIGQAFLHEGHLRIVIDIRYPVTKKTEDFLPKLQTEAAKSGIRIIGIEDSRPYYMNPEQPFIQTLMEAWREVTGLEGRPFVMGGGTYARKIPNAVAFGPGQERNLDRLGLPKGHGNCHCADEAELFENLKNAVKIYVFALKKLDKRIKETR